MRFSTMVALLLVAAVAHAQLGQRNNKQNSQTAQNDQKTRSIQSIESTQTVQSIQSTQIAQKGQNGQNNNQNNAALALNPANVQTGSQSNGFANGDEAGQAASATDDANFINFCQGKTLTNGLQVKGGSCNGIVMGDIPASNRMVSTVFLSPQDGEDIAPNERINFQVKIANLQAGSFTNPDVTYYAAPQALNGGGQVVGHTHISVQDMNGVKNPTNTLDAETFAFFKGINDAGDGQGTLSANLTKGLPAGFYRVCSMTSASNHQPVLMPVAQRGSQDDCVRFTVGQNQTAAAGDNQQGQGQGQQGQGQGQKGQGQQGQDQKGQDQQGQAGANAGGRGRGRYNRLKFAARDFIA